MCIICYCTLGSLELGNVRLTVNLAALYTGTRIYIYASLLIFFNISACYRFSRLDNQIYMNSFALSVAACK